MSSEYNPLSFPPELLTSWLKAFEVDSETATINGGTVDNLLFDLLKKPQLVRDDEFHQEMMDYKIAQEKWFEEWIDQSRNYFLFHYHALSTKEQKSRFRTASDLLKWANESDFLEEVVIPFVDGFGGVHAPRASRDIRAFLQAAPPWRQVLVGMGIAAFNRIFRSSGYGRSSSAQCMDMQQLVYLPFCDRFVTDDKPYRRRMLLLAREFAERRPRIVYFDFLRRELLARA